MAEARRRQRWKHTSSLMRQLCHVNGVKTNAGDFDPYACKQEKKSAEVPTRVGLAALAAICVPEFRGEEGRQRLMEIVTGSPRPQS